MQNPLFSMLTDSFPITLFSVFLFFALSLFYLFLYFFYILLKKISGDHYIWSPPLLYCVKLVSQNFIYQDHMYTIVDAREPCNVGLTAYCLALNQTFRTFACNSARSLSAKSYYIRRARITSDPINCISFCIHQLIDTYYHYYLLRSEDYSCHSVAYTIDVYDFTIHGHRIGACKENIC